MPPKAQDAAGLSYAASGVDLESKDQFTESLGSLMRRTFGPRVIDNPGGFAGLFRLDFNERLFARNYKDPVLVACADGVGTKLKLAIDLNRYDTLGIDLVAMNVNDMIVQGAEPLFFLDYIAIGKVDKSVLTDLVKGMVEGCRRAGCALLGGETAEMPGLYRPGDFDLAGFAVGVVDLDRAIKPTRVEVGDVVLGLASDGIHSNGYSLVRTVVEKAGLDLSSPAPELEPAPKARAKGRKRSAQAAPARTLGEILLTPTRIYVRPIVKLLSSYRVKKVIGGMAHITGSGMSGNLCRALHPKVDAVIDREAWPVPPVFRYLQKHGRIDEEEMRRVFNMGIGYCLIVRPTFAESVKEQLEKLGERVYTIGRIAKGTGQVREIN
ncbi:MAG: phosphoribosylformylglycinamidine cyclo-ligase [Phycisphaeraceae bacterium]|nr:phosphoribosylformylglycinamidine cyclo-ligase [Phycisphaeraceae bacterium]